MTLRPEWRSMGPCTAKEVSGAREGASFGAAVPLADRFRTGARGVIHPIKSFVQRRSVNSRSASRAFRQSCSGSRLSLERGSHVNREYREIHAPRRTNPRSVRIAPPYASEPAIKQAEAAVLRNITD